LATSGDSIPFTIIERGQVQYLYLISIITIDLTC
jgi:hypothetical protein